ncbi:MAG: hypothetical protein ABR920_08510 [Terriglobales bacterium]
MKSARLRTKGFTLIASLLLLLLLSGMAIGLLMMVNTEGKVGGTDLQNAVAYHAAEGGIEKMASDLAGVLQNAQATTASEICGVGGPTFGGSAANLPAMTGVTWKEYQVTPGALGSNCPTSIPKPATGSNWNPIQSGPNQGLWAQVIPISMQATAALPGGQEVSMMRSAQIALIPVFQFGAFSEGDLAFFSTPNLDFNGRVHTNGDLYLGVGGGNTLTFHHKLEAYGNVVENYIPNGLTVGNANDTGTVYIPTNDPGCTPNTTTSCVTKATNGGSAYGDGSVQGKGGNPPQSTYIPASGTDTWTPFSATATNHELINGNYGNTAAKQAGTGARKLSMPFVNGTNYPYEIIRRPPAGEATSTALSDSREYNMAQIRVLLSDDPTEFQNGSGYSDTNNVRLANVTQNSTTATQYGVTLTSGNIGPSFTANSYNLYFATASNSVPINCNSANPCSEWPYPPAPWTSTLAAPTASAVPLLYSNTTVAAPYDTAASIPTLNSSGNITSPLLPVILCPSQAVLGHLPLTAANGGPYSAACPTQPANTPVSPYYYYQTGATTSVASTGNIATDVKSQQTATWNLIDGWLRVEYKDSSGNWHPVTNEWLQLGFARDVTSPTANMKGKPTTGKKNPINPNAILLLQEPADRLNPSISATLPTTAVNTAAWTTNTSGWAAPTCTATHTIGSTTYCSAWTGDQAPLALVDTTGGVYWEFGPSSSPTAQSVTQYNWYPINFYDAREGEARDVDQGNNSCTTNGAMNAVEIDVGNLQQWLNGNIGTSGPSVDYATQNGYVLYFSDRRGMLLNPNITSSHPAGTKSGDSGLEDVVNSSSQAGTPDGGLEPTFAGAPLSPSGVALSPEDVNENGVLDNWGTASTGLGQYNGVVNQNAQIFAATPDNPYSPRIASCGTTGRKNWVSGARHVLKLVDGSLGNLPITPVGTPETIAGNTATYYGGFTVASENPVYIQGDYNSVTSPTEDTFFTNQQNTAPAKDEAGYVPASIVADAVTLLSNSWDDRVSMVGIPGNTDVTYRVNGGNYAGNREATTTSYRVAIAGGKNMAFPFPNWANTNPDYPFGTDGGVGNFLRFLEDWSGQALNYGGSLVSLYYSTYNTGIFKCCTYAVYSPPTRNYVFDVDFTLPGGVGLPPGTPLFRDVETLGYRQLFTTRTN